MIPRLRFAHLPTPIEPLPRLSAYLSGPSILIKRDDQTGLAFGGNKSRKLEFLIAEAQSQGSDTLISTGAIQSNHCRQTAAAAAKFGFNCVLVLTGKPPLQASANLLLDHLFGAEIIWAEKGMRDSVLLETFQMAVTHGKKPYLVPYGGSSSTGVLGYVYAVEEYIKQQVRADWIVFASSSGGTQAGLVLGSRIFGNEGQVLGISIEESQHSLQNHVSILASETSERLGSHIDFNPDQILVNDDYAFPGYGVLTGAEREAVSLFAKQEGLLLDPVYTGRAAAGLIDLVRKGFFKRDDTVLFWHTGGQPALFADKYQPDLAYD